MLCEGKVSEPAYVRGLKRVPEIGGRTALTIELAPERDVPLPLVQAAIPYTSREEVDEVWCLFDVEHPHQHPHLDEALRLAEAYGIRVAVSNPCFEVWLVLHHRDWNRPGTTTHDAETAANACHGVNGKALDPAVILPLRHDAARRARALDTRHERDGTPFPRNNPSSGMHRFLDAVESREA